MTLNNKVIMLTKQCSSRLSMILLAALIAGPTYAGAQIEESAMKQIHEIAALKHSFTPAERKMSFNLILISRAAQHKLPADLAHLIDKKSLDGKGNAIVDVEGFMTPQLLSSPGMAGVEKENDQIPQPAYTSGKVRAHVRTTLLLDLAGHPDVKALHDPERSTTNIGSLTSQGYVSHSANKVVGLGVTGAGTFVGVLSDSASPAAVSALIASGDLPPDVTVLPGQAGTGSDEGTAMLEIVHDMAPGAKLFFATASSGSAQFAANIRALRFIYHCDILVDDVTYFGEAVFQDDIIAQAVNDVTADGALYFSSAANSGNLTSGTSGTWEGDFSAGPNGSGLLAGAGILHNFGTDPSPVLYDTLKTPSTFIDLKWSDPLNAASDDYDLYILNATGTAVVAASASTQDGTQNPIEAVSGTFPAGDRIVAVLFNGDRRALHIDTNRAQLTIGTSGATYGHNAGRNTFSTAAVYWNSAHIGAKPFIGGAINPDEVFSSDGPRQIFFQPDGTPITPGNYLFSTNGGTTLIKPDAAGADGVTVKTKGFNPFYGTSAAAPHLAGIASLVKSANPSLTNVQIRQIMTGTTLDNMEPGVDRDSGYGIVMALPAVQSAQTLAAAAVKAAQPR